LPASNDIKKRSEEIQLLIASDEVQQAIKLLLSFTRDFSEDSENINEVIVISQSYNRLEKLERRGTVDLDKADEQRRKILYQMLDFIESIKDSLFLKLAA
jgi:hypothetical protein